MSEALVYEGRDLESMSFARNYHAWILELFEPYLGSRLVEVGAGTGSFSELLLARGPQSLSLVEPSAMYDQLVQNVARLPQTERVRAYNDTFAQVAERVREETRPDSIIYVNVLEHVADDEEELALVHGALGMGGRAFVFVPALPWLYGSFDEMVGHRRRYARRELEAKVVRAGFRVLKSVYFDSAGVLPWWMKYRLLRSRRMEPGAVRFYDSFVVPVLKRIETLAPPPVGKNLLLVAEKI
jgi:SAM-dependent methyltransferase